MKSALTDAKAINDNIIVNPLQGKKVKLHTARWVNQPIQYKVRHIQGDAYSIILKAQDIQELIDSELLTDDIDKADEVGIMVNAKDYPEAYEQAKMLAAQLRQKRETKELHEFDANKASVF